MCLHCIQTWCSASVIVLGLLFSNGISHKFVSMSLGPSIMTLSSLNTWTFPFLNTTVQFASHSTGTDISVRSMSLNPCPFCAPAGNSDDSLSCLVVVASIVFVLATPTLICSCGSSSPRYLCLLDRNRLVAAESGCPCGILLLSTFVLR